MRAAGYLRVSSESQVDGHSLAAQERQYYDFINAREWQSTGIYREEGKSAHSETISRRLVFQQLLEDAKNRKFDVVVVHTLDRWSRNLRVTLETLKELNANDIGLISITENIDYSTAQGKLFTQMLGSFAEYFSESLATHIKKGQSERARSGRHLGGIPFGYLSCWTGKDGNRVLTCEAEHPGGVHQVPEEATAIKELFKRYAAGGTSTADLAIWMNEQGFRTRNTKRLPTHNGTETAGPRYFTNASIRGILHNRFYAGFVKHGKHQLPGEHEPIVSDELFESVQLMMSKNSGRSASVGRRRKTRTYLLQGLARCADCGMNLWAQTYRNGRSYYREQRASRSHGQCPANGGSIPCEVVDERIGAIFKRIVLPEDWRSRVTRQIKERDEVARLIDERARLKERLRRLGLAFVDGIYDESEYHRQKQNVHAQLESLAIPDFNFALKAGELIDEFAHIWEYATVEERHNLITSLLDAVYVDMNDPGAPVSIKPKTAFEPIWSLVPYLHSKSVNRV